MESVDPYDFIEDEVNSLDGDISVVTWPVSVSSDPTLCRLNDNPKVNRIYCANGTGLEKPASRQLKKMEDIYDKFESLDLKYGKNVLSHEIPEILEAEGIDDVGLEYVSDLSMDILYDEDWNKKMKDGKRHALFEEKLGINAIRSSKILGDEGVTFWDLHDLGVLVRDSAIYERYESFDEKRRMYQRESGMFLDRCFDQVYLIDEPREDAPGRYVVAEGPSPSTFG